MFNLDLVWGMPRPLKRFVSVVVDIVFISLALWGAFYARLGEVSSYLSNPEYWHVLLASSFITIVFFIHLGLYRAILRYMGMKAIATIVSGALVSALSVVLFSYYFQVFLPRSVPILYTAFLVSLCGGSRLLVRFLVSDLLGSHKIPVIIYGAGKAGRQLQNILKQGEEYRVVAFIDDNRKLHRTMIQGVSVFRRKYLARTIEQHKVVKVLMAMPTASSKDKKSVIEALSKFPVEVLTIPNFADIVNGRLKIDHLKEVAIEDLLGRDPVEPSQELLDKNIKDKVVMVTGAGGSIGSELCRQIIQQQPDRLVLFEISEFSLYQIDRELSGLVSQAGLSVEIIPLLGSVQRIHRLSNAMKSFKVQTVYHAAAYKHVPLVEYNVVEGVRNNVFGTYYTAQAAIEAGVESFVLISTDKAVRPTNVMGTTKRMAELGLQALAEQEELKENGTRFCMVRFGNVLGSSGSVIPLFKKQIAMGGPVTVTHPDIIRYFMTIPEAAQLVIQAGAMGKGGDVFVLDMGEPVKIAELAKNLIHLSGLEIKDESNPDGEIEIHYSGLRPGEKLFEELLIGDNVNRTAHQRILTANESYLSVEDYQVLLQQIDDACHITAHEKIRQLLLDAPTGFAPTDGIGDLVWNASQRA